MPQTGRKLRTGVHDALAARSNRLARDDTAEITVVVASLLLVLAFAAVSYFNVYPLQPSWGSIQQTAAAQTRTAVQ